jgi:TrmH family RNA methyltransferase
LNSRKYENDEGVITGIKHDAVSAARSETRASGPSYLVDGYRLVSQAAEGFAHVERAFFLDPVESDRCRKLMAEMEASEAEVYRVTRGVFFRILDLGYETSVEVLAQVRRPGPADVLGMVTADTCLMIGEQIQDPRNVGVMVRTADAWQPAAVVLSDDSADPWCRAAVRSSTGSIFRMPLALAEDLPAYVRALKERGVRIVGTSAHAPASVWQTDLTGPCALVLGNESVGMSDELTAECDEFVTIPMHGGASSFNVTVAAGILLYERERQRMG